MPRTASSEQSATPAQRDLAERQRKDPPRYPLNSRGFDRARALAGVLHPDLPADLRSLVDSGVVAVGEVGKFEPTITTFPIRDRAFVIELCTGLMDFYYAVGRALAGTLVVFSDSPTPQNRQALELPDVVDLVAKVYGEWRRYAERSWPLSLFHKETRIQHAAFALAEVARWPIETLVTSAELFMLAHEFGHVALDRGLRTPPTDNDELNADTIGFELYMPPVTAAFDKRMAYAGAGFAIRVTAGLERIGVKFSRRYPSPEKRLDNLRRLLEQSCPSPQYCDEASTIMVAYQDLMDDVDNRFAPGSAPAAPGADRARVRIIAELNEVARGRHTREKMVTHLQDIARTLPDDAMRAIFARLHEYYVLQPPLESYLSLDMRAAMGAELIACGFMLPPALRALAGTQAVLDHVKAALDANKGKEGN